MPAASEPRPASRAAFAFVFVTVLLDMLAIGIMVPVLPKLVEQFASGNIARAAEITGIFGTAWAAMQFVFSPLVGALSDRFGRRPLILLSNFGMAADYLVMALAPSLGWLFVGRLISGVTAASVPIATAYISDVTEPEKRAEKFGMLGAAFGLGFIIGPAVGGFLGQVSLRLPFWAAGALSLANAAYGFFILPESLPRAKRSPLKWKGANPLGAMKLLRSHPEVFALAITCLLFFLAHEALPNTFVLYADYRYGWSTSAVGFALGAVGVCQTIVSAGLVGPIVRVLGERRALAMSLFCGVIGFAIAGLAPTGVLFLACIPFNSLLGVSSPAMQAVMTRRVDANAQGQLQGALSSVRGITGMIGPLLFTEVFAVAIHHDPQWHLPGAAFLLSSVLLGGGVVIALRTVRAHEGSAELAVAPTPPNG